MQLRLCHALHVVGEFALLYHALLELGVVSLLGHVSLDGQCACRKKQGHEEEQHEEVAALRVEGVGGGLHATSQGQEIVGLSLEFLLLVEQHVYVLDRHQGR